MRRWNQRKVEAIEHMGGKCQICNRSDFHPVEFDFHHKYDKQDTWTKLRLKSWDKITKELKKCMLLCCGCHRKEHINKELW